MCVFVFVCVCVCTSSLSSPALCLGFVYQNALCLDSSSLSFLAGVCECADGEREIERKSAPLDNETSEHNGQKEDNKSCYLQHLPCK